MTSLWSITILWAFSFSLIGEYLAGEVDAYIAVASRMALALLIFIPFFKKINPQEALMLMAIGSIEVGIMYLFLYQSYTYLTVQEILLFTIFTPIYVSLFSDLLARRRPKNFWIPALVAVAGAALIRWTNLNGGYWTGFLLIQCANACFALGQVCYRHCDSVLIVPIKERFAWFFLGAFITTSVASMVLADWSQYPQTYAQISVLLWLGIIASGVGYLGWSYGSTKVSSQQLAVMNNMLIPAGILINVVIWQGTADWGRVVIGTGFIGLALILTKIMQKHVHS